MVNVKFESWVIHVVFAVEAWELHQAGSIA